MTRTAVTDADFYLLEQSLDDEGRQFLRRVREFMEKSVQPVINDCWTREEFPFDLMDGFRGLGIPGQLYQGYGCPGGGYLLDGMIAMELARVDPSISTFFGVHGGLAMGSIFLGGSEEQKRRWLPEMARMEKIGAFGLTEPDVGSGVAGGLTTTARRDGTEWVLDGQKKWIGNATFADCVVILHVVPVGTWETRNERLLRDHLRDNPADARRYAELKQRLAAEHADGTEYTQAKTELIQELTDRARAERGLPSVPVWEE